MAAIWSLSSGGKLGSAGEKCASPLLNPFVRPYVVLESKQSLVPIFLNSCGGTGACCKHCSSPEDTGEKWEQAYFWCFCVIAHNPNAHLPPTPLSKYSSRGEVNNHQAEHYWKNVKQPKVQFSSFMPVISNTTELTEAEFLSGLRSLGLVPHFWAVIFLLLMQGLRNRTRKSLSSEPTSEENPPWGSQSVKVIDDN